MRFSPIRIPVRLVDGQWEYFYGGPLPIHDGTVGELIIDKSAIKNKAFLAHLKETREHKILEVDTALLVCLTIKPSPELSAELKARLIPRTDSSIVLGSDYHEPPRSPYTQFVRISIGPPTEQQLKVRPSAEGGIWLHVQGLQPKALTTSGVKIPDLISKEPLESLNHAFTRLSEAFEPWRQSHTGNIYDRILYQEKNQRWYPLSVLRNAAIARDEHELIRERWAQWAQQLEFDF